jgi:predicted nuclease of predicted toxin-antitoxin system
MTSKPAKSFKFLVDVNLPKKFSYFNNENFLHIVDVNPCMTDKDIWNYALANNLVLLSKDADFFNLYLTEENHPKVVHFKIGNLTLEGLHLYFSNFWPTLVQNLEHASLS